MKHISYVFAVIAILATASCAKELAPESALEVKDTNLSFFFNEENAKTSLTETGAVWVAGDKIWLSNGTDNETVTLAAGNINGNKASVSTTLDIAGKTVYAVYPASAAKEIDGGQIKFNIPAAQDGSYGKANICAAKGAGSSLEMKNITSVLKYEAKNTVIYTVGVKLAGIAGDYKVNLDGAAPALTAVAATDSVTVTPETAPFYFAVAPVTVPVGTTFDYKEGTEATIGSKQTTQVNTLEAGKLYNLGMALVQGAMPAVFSVGANKKVTISQGNLQMCPKDNLWKFADNQWDVCGGRTGTDPNFVYTGNVYYKGARCFNNMYIKSATLIDLFGWATSGYRDESDTTVLYYNPWDAGKAATAHQYNKYGYGPMFVSESASSLTDENAYYDWGQYNPISNGGNVAGLWRTLTVDEFKFLLGGTAPRATTKRAYCTIQIDAQLSRQGIIVMPDNWTGSFGAPVSGQNIAISQEKWAEYQAAGAILLPSASTRNQWAAPLSVNTKAVYWTVTAKSETYAYQVQMDQSRNGWVNYSGNDRFIGCAVRLVSDL